MSLINDLMIEIDRRDKESNAEGTLRVDGAMPNLGARPKPARPRTSLVVSASLFAGALALAVWLTSGPVTETQVGNAEAGVIRPPAVSARPAESGESANEDSAATVDASDEIRIRRISLERGAQTTSLLIAADARAPYRIEGAGLEREIEIVIEGATSSQDQHALDLERTTIRSLQTQHDGDDFRIRLALEDIARIQSHWIEGVRGPILAVDIQIPPRPSRTLESRDEARSNFVDTVVDAALPELPEVSSDRPRGELRIGRSADDRRRFQRQVLLNEVAEVLREARIARSQGAFKEAIALFRSALTRAPDHKEATLELAQLLAETDAFDDALDLVTRARRLDPADASFVMLEASFVARKGDLSSAVAILDDAKLALSDAPEVHALAAAYVQQTGDHQNAIHRYETILRRYPSQAVWWMGLGISLEASERYVEATEVYGIAMQVGELSRETRTWISARVAELAEKD